MSFSLVFLPPVFLAFYHAIHVTLGWLWLRRPTLISNWALGFSVHTVLCFALRSLHVWSFTSEIVSLLFVSVILTRIFRDYRSSSTHPILGWSLIPKNRSEMTLVFVGCIFLGFILLGSMSPAVLSPDWDAVDTWIPMYRELVKTNGFAHRPDLLYSQLALSARFILTPSFIMWGGMGVKVFNALTLGFVAIGFSEWTFLLLRSWKFSQIQCRAASFGAGFFTLTSPTFMQNAAIAYHDMIFLAFLLALACEVWARVSEDDDKQQDHAAVVPCLMGIYGVLASGTKSIGYFQVGWILLVLMALSRSFRGSFLCFFVFTVGFVLHQVPVYWLTGNPVFPLASEFFSTAGIDQQRRDQLRNISHLSVLFSSPVIFLKDIFLGPWDLVLNWPPHNYRTSPLLFTLAPLGWQNLNQRNKTEAFSVAVALFFLYLLWQVTSLDARYFYPAYLLLIPLMGWAWASWSEDNHFIVFRKAAQAMVVFMIAFFLIQTYFQHRKVLAWLAHHQTEEDFRRLHSAAPSLVSALLERHLWETPKILCGAEHIDLMGPQTYGDITDYLGTTYYSLEKALAGDPIQLERFSQKQISIAVLTPKEAFLNQGPFQSLLKRLNQSSGTKLLFESSDGFIYELPHWSEKN